MEKNWKLRQFYQNTITSIAFLPAIISACFFVFSLFSLYVEFSSLGIIIKENMGVLLVKGNDNARQVLGTLIGGIISLTVFSFSMVMVVINQASSQFTPRVLPGLLGDKKNQFILGFYVGTIIYCIILIVNIEPGESRVSTQIGVLMAMFFGIFCLGLFIYFIHLIFLKIQVDHIISMATYQAVHAIVNHDKINTATVLLSDTSNTHTLITRQTGYLSEINTGKLNRICERYQLQVRLLHATGTFLLEGEAICLLNMDIDQRRKVQEKLLSCFKISNIPYSENSFLYNINQITEIAIKALSPGINDPGTATIALDYLSHIFCYLLKHRFTYSNHISSHSSFFTKDFFLEDLLFKFVRPISHYGQGDAKIHQKLLEFYERLLTYAPTEMVAVLKKYMAAEETSIRENICTMPESNILNAKIITIHTRFNVK